MVKIVMDRMRPFDEATLMWQRAEAILRDLEMQYFKSCTIYMPPIDEDGNECVLRFGGKVVSEIHCTTTEHKLITPSSEVIPDPDVLQGKTKSSGMFRPSIH